MRRRAVRAILFDLDGVLADSYQAWFSIVNDSLRAMKREPLSKREFKKRFGAPIEKDARTHFKGIGIEGIKRLYTKFFWRRKKLIRPIDGAEEILAELKKRKMKIGLISNNNRKIILSTLHQLKIRGYFDIIMTMDEVKRRKPHPEMVIKACKMLEISPREAIVVGDTQNDMLAGKRAGCATIGYRTKGDHTISCLSLLKRFLK